MGPGDQAVISIISHNPFVDELFRWHPKAAQIRIVNAKHFFMTFSDPRDRMNAGVPRVPPIPFPVKPREPIRVYPSPRDLTTLDRELPKKPFLAIAPTASGMEIEDRNLPAHMIASALKLCRDRDIQVVFLGRTYNGPHAHKSPPKLPEGPGIVNLTNRLSVPGSIDVVKRAQAVFSCHSCLLLQSWYDRKPVFAAYPPKYEWHDFINPSPFGFGKDYPETTRVLFDRYLVAKFDAFLSKNFP